MKKKAILRKVEQPVKRASKIMENVVIPAPRITEKVRRKVTPADLVEVQDSSLLVAIDLKRQQPAEVEAMEIEEGQRFFPYAVLPRLMVGWQAIGFISSFELKVTPEYPLPQIIVRFVEKLSKDEVSKLDAATKAQIEANIALVKQYPFVTVESPLLPPGG